MSVKAAFDTLVHQLVMPTGVTLKLKALSLIGILAQLTVYELRCTISQYAVELYYETLTGSSR